MKKFLVAFMIKNYKKKIKNNGIYHIEKILKSRTRKSERQLLVSRLGYNSDFDSWVAAEDVQKA